MPKTSRLLCFVIFAIWFFANVSESKPEVGIYELKRGDFSLKLTNWGASIISLVLPDKYGKLADVVLGYDSVKDYMNDTTYFGATVGRVANRIGGARFTLNGTLYKLDANEGKNTLHGGTRGFSDVIWKVKKYHNEGHSPYITFSYHSFDGEEGFPGALLVTVTYALVGQSMAIIMKAKAQNKATPVNLAHHTYWNLGGHNSGDILSNEIQIFGSHTTPVDKQLIPTGKIAPVKGTPYDFLQPAPISSKIMQLPNGYDINYCLDGGASKEFKTAAIVHDKKSGRVMELLTNQPGVQFYTGNYINDLKGKGGFVYQAHAGLCLETQGFPDSVNHPNFPSQIVTHGKKYVHRMLFKFSTKAA
ncbi:Aldose 1-epimerase [Actinidia chinensis var. chinensis]|uniref:Aldose 1-epimerase n=1 Tax=Actinidia chinensis var. chinensis TaxID=1590841 RepID=A0A2R6RUK1_ACTCC|nr:Aldose 1-epimerase [Actinidia chinensis var. chinensis]